MRRRWSRGHNRMPRWSPIRSYDRMPRWSPIRSYDRMPSWSQSGSHERGGTLIAEPRKSHMYARSAQRDAT